MSTYVMKSLYLLCGLLAVATPRLQTVSAAPYYGCYSQHFLPYGHQPLFGPIDCPTPTPTPTPTPAPTAAPRPAKPCGRVGAKLVNQWDDGVSVKYQYQVDVDNQCNYILYDQPVRLLQHHPVLQYWNIDYDDNTNTFRFPGWAVRYGVHPQQRLTFGFITDARASLAV